MPLDLFRHHLFRHQHDLPVQYLFLQFEIRDIPKVLKLFQQCSRCYVYLLGCLSIVQTLRGLLLLILEYIPDVFVTADKNVWSENFITGWKPDLALWDVFNLRSANAWWRDSDRSSFWTLYVLFYSLFIIYINNNL